MRITTIAPLSYTPGRLSYFQFIRGGVGADHHQEPRFYQYPDGEVLAFWNAYDYDECSGNAVKLYAVSRDRGLTWTDPQVFMADYLGGVPYGVSLLRLAGSEETLMLWTRSRHAPITEDLARRVVTAGSDYFRSRTSVFLRRSADGGRTFDHGYELPYQAFTGGRCLPGGGWYGSLDCLLQLRSGHVLAAFQFMDPERSDHERKLQHYTGACLLSADDGRTWERGGEITVDTPRGVMELQIVETEPDRLFCVFRTKGGYLYQTVSGDGGKTWSPSAPSPLPSPESMARMIQLQSGDLLVAWNNVSSTTQHPRHPLSAAVSSDGGYTWSRPKLIADETGTHQLSNHGLTQLDDGRVLLGITHYRDVRPMTSDFDLAIFDEQWLAGP